MDWRGAVFMVRPERVELSTFSLGMKCSIHLSYGRTEGIIADFAIYQPLYRIPIHLLPSATD
jgi:hypothetical protein